MKRFHFPLESILELRQWEEREKEIALGKSLRECIYLRKQVESRKEKERESFLKRGETLEIDRFAAVEWYGYRMRKEAEILKRRLSQKEVEKDKAQEEFIEASKKRKVLDKLKEREAVVYRKKQLVSEQFVLDEIGSALAARKRSEDLSGEG